MRTLEPEQRYFYKDGKWGVITNPADGLIDLDQSCTNDCPRCYNGGICNEYSGVCICGPGFYGPTCQDICEAETWGSECQSGISK